MTDYAQMSADGQTIDHERTVMSLPADLTLAAWLADDGPMGGAWVRREEMSSIEGDDGRIVVSRQIRREYNQWLGFHMSGLRRHLNVIGREQFKAKMAATFRLLRDDGR